MKISSDTIGNRTRDLPACTAVPQPTAPPRTPDLCAATWNPYWEASIPSASQQHSPIFMEPEDPLPCSQYPKSEPHSSPDYFNLHPLTRGTKLQAQKSHTTLRSTFCGPLAFIRKVCCVPQSLSVRYDENNNLHISSATCTNTTTHNIHTDMDNLITEKPRPHISSHCFNRNLKYHFHFPISYILFFLISLLICFHVLLLKVPRKCTQL
jgi:hypothetical protein